MRIVTSQKSTSTSGQVVSCEGKLWRFRPTADGQFSVASDVREMPMPTNVTGILRRPSWRNYNFGQRSRLFGAGAWSANMVIDELMRAMRQGIPAPFVVPTVAAAAGPGTSGEAICYLRFLDSRGGRVGPKSAPAPTITLTNQGRAWTVLPTTCLDSSVDSLQGLVSMDGATPRVAWTRQLGVTSVTENTATLALGQADPGEFTELPLGGFNEVYHERQWIAGNDRFPQRAFASALGEQERYEGLFVDTDGEWVSGMFTQNDLLFLGSFHKIYRVAGYTPADLSREVEKPDVGLINHHGIVNLHKRSIVPTTEGFQLYDGQWHYLMDDRRSEWKREYRANRAAYEAAQGYYHPLRNVFMFGPVPHSELGVDAYWTLDAKRLTPEIEADEFGICWANDVRGNAGTTRATFYLPGSSQPQAAAGTNYGMLLDDFGGGGSGYLIDDDVTAQVTITPATLMPDPGGSPLDGNKFHRLFPYIQSPNNDYEVRLKAGQENCALNAGFQERIQIPIVEDLSASEARSGPTPYLIRRCAGEAISLTIVSPGTKRDTFVFRGYGMTHAPGIKARLRVVPGPEG